jgi:dihydroxyacetone kinase-like protein
VVTADGVVRALLGVLAATEEAQTELDSLDAIAGDGDHGVTMVIGWRAVAAALTADQPQTPGAALRTAAAAFAGVGGSAGPLWGTALLRAGRVLSDSPAIDVERLAAAAEAAVEGMRERGRCALGDRTVVDAMAPAAVALQSARDLPTALASAAEAAAKGANATATLTPQRGRAARAPERVRGHVDAGARAAQVFWGAVSRAACASMPSRNVAG